jgi:hypothetical protein
MKDGDQLPITTPLLSRLRMFQPTHRPQLLAGDWTETAHGQARVKGRLGQRHIDALESMLRTSTAREVGGRIELLVDPALVRRSLSDEGYSGEGLQVLLDDLFEAEIEIKTPKLQSRGRIIDLWRRSTKTAANPLGGERQMWFVKFGDLMTYLLQNDTIFCRSHPTIPKLRSGVAKALARAALSHSHQPKGGWRLDSMIESVCGPLSRQQTRDKRRDIVGDAAGLLAAGVKIECGRVFLA